MADATPQGYQGYTSAQGDYNRTVFIVKQILAGVRTAVPVEVMAVSVTPGTDGAAGYVDVKPLVNQVDVAGNSTPHETIHNIPYFRLHGGGNAVILDPAINDIGWMLCADRDISTVKKTGKAANPASNRKFDLADGMYLGGFLGPAPTQEIRFASDGIHIKTPNTIFLEGNAKVTGNLEVDGTMNGGGGTGGKKVVLDGDAVTTGGTVIASSTQTKAN